MIAVRYALAWSAAVAGLNLLAPASAQTASGDVDADVLTRAVQRGEVLGAEDFTTERIAAARARDALSAHEAAGLEAKRALRAGMPVHAGDLIAPRVVRRGEPVKIVVRNGALLITTHGRALGDAAKGEPVRVFSEATNQTLDTIAEGSASVRIAIH